MWDRTTDRLFLELRADAVLLFDRQSERLLHMNSAAAQIFGNVPETALLTDLFSDAAIEKLVRRTVATGVMSVLTPEHTDWFKESAVVHVVLTEWGEIPAVGITIDRRAYGPPPEAMQMMRAVLTSAYFTALRVDLSDLTVSVISDKNPLMNTQAKFSSFSDFSVHAISSALLGSVSHRSSNGSMAEVSLPPALMQGPRTKPIR